MSSPTTCHDASAAPSGGAPIAHPRPPRGPALTVCGTCAGETRGGGEEARARQLSMVRGLAERRGTGLTVVDCLDACERGDVVVVRPSTAGRAAGGAPAWFQKLADAEAMATVGEWLDAGGPGVAPQPSALARFHIDDLPVDPDVEAVAD